MTHQLTLSDDRYQTVVEMAAARGQTPEELLESLVDAAWEQACAPYDAAFENDPDWQASAREAVARGDEPHGTVYSSTADFLRALGASPQEVEEARSLESGGEPPTPAR